MGPSVHQSIFAGKSRHAITSTARTAERFAADTCRKDRHRHTACEPRPGAVLRASDMILLATVTGTPCIHDAQSMI